MLYACIVFDKYAMSFGVSGGTCDKPFNNINIL